MTVDWRPPTAGTEDALARVFPHPRRTGANAEAVARMLAAGAVPGGRATDRRPGRPRPGQFSHAGPPIDLERASGPMRGALVGAMLFEGYAAAPDAPSGPTGRGPAGRRHADPAAAVP